MHEDINQLKQSGTEASAGGVCKVWLKRHHDELEG
jgi:hypothetical protein